MVPDNRRADNKRKWPGIIIIIIIIITIIFIYDLISFKQGKRNKEN